MGITDSETDSDTSSALDDLRGDSNKTMDDPIKADIDLDYFMDSANHARHFQVLQPKIKSGCGKYQ